MTQCPLPVSEWLAAPLPAVEGVLCGHADEAQVNFYPDGRFHLRQHKDHNRQHRAM